MTNTIHAIPFTQAHAHQIARAKAGYAYKGVHENVSTGQHPPNEKINDHLPAQHQLDNLMTAIYHRFSLLDQNIDEAGAAF